jgi:hypothetical protein
MASPDPISDPLGQARETIRDFLARARRRKTAAESLRGAEPFVLALFAATAALELALRLSGDPAAALLPWIAAAAAAAAGAAVVLRAPLARRGSARSERVALEADRSLRLEEALPTASDLLASGDRGIFADALLVRTAEVLRAASVPRLFPVRCAWSGWAASALLMLVLALFPMPAADLSGDDARERPPRAGGDGMLADPRSPRPLGGDGSEPTPGEAPTKRDGPSPTEAREQPEPSPGNGKGGGDGKDERGGKPPLFGDPERTPAQFEDVKVKPLFGPEGQSRFLELEVPLPRVRGGGRGAGDAEDLEMEQFDLLIRYEKIAEKAMSAGRVAPNDRKAVLDYFERVRRMVGRGGEEKR